ncbi:MAG: MCE family protein [Alphaproteobacteria bacterium]|nr:MCE family protein [Alphaproteobacteria bacterium]
MTRGILETVLGAIVLLVALGFGGYIYSAREASSSDTYALTMRFGSVQGLKPAAEVRLGGVKIGLVASMQLDPATLEAIVEVQINEDIKLPRDSVAEIMAVGLLGNNFLNIRPGFASERLAIGAEFERTIDPVSLEDLLGQAIFALSER